MKTLFSVSANKLLRGKATDVLESLSTNLYKLKICDSRPKVELAKQNLWQKKIEAELRDSSEANRRSKLKLSAIKNNRYFSAFS